jgi:hypothetical protein
MEVSAKRKSGKRNAIFSQSIPGRETVLACFTDETATQFDVGAKIAALQASYTPKAVDKSTF